MKARNKPGQSPSTTRAEELGFDPTLIEQNLRLSSTGRIKQASQAAHALLKPRAALSASKLTPSL